MTSKVDHLVIFAAIFSNTFTAHAQKRLFMNLQLNFWRRHSIPAPDVFQECEISAIWLRFPTILYILYAECLPYFYFSFVWPTDLAIIPTKCEVDMTIHGRVRVFCLLIRYMTLWPWPLTFWPWPVVTHGGSRVQPCHQVWRPYACSFLSYQS